MFQCDKRQRKSRCLAKKRHRCDEDLTVTRLTEKLEHSLLFFFLSFPLYTILSEFPLRSWPLNAEKCCGSVVLLVLSLDWSVLLRSLSNALRQNCWVFLLFIVELHFSSLWLCFSLSPGLCALCPFLSATVGSRESRLSSSPGFLDLHLHLFSLFSLLCLLSLFCLFCLWSHFLLAVSSLSSVLFFVGKSVWTLWFMKKRGPRTCYPSC